MEKGPRHEDVRTALSRLVTHGADAIWLPEVQPLLALAVSASDDQSASAEPAEALREMLRDAVERLGSSQYRHLLTVVLGLESRYEALATSQRREVAGLEFRGGKSQVQPGTIRQYHEPRALDELADLLMSQHAGGDVATPGNALRSPQELAVEWHPQARRVWAGERLSFWRLAFSAYERERTISVVRATLRRMGVKSYALIELFGQFDLLLRVWLPSEQFDLERALEDEFRGDPGLIIDRFEVTDVLHHWLWDSPSGMLSPSAEQLATTRPPTDLDRADALDLDSESNMAYRQAGLLAVALPADGIDIVLVVSPPARSLPRGAHDRLREMLRSALRHSGLENQSVYAGYGFASFLICGRVSPDRFMDLAHDLVAPINEGIRSFGARTTTMIVASPNPLAREEAMRGGGTDRPALTARDWLHELEGSEFEVKATAFSSFQRWLKQGEVVLERAAAQPVLKAIAALLNGDGGTLLIGAVEAEAFREHGQLAESPRVGRYVVHGLNHEMPQGWDGFQARLYESVCRHIDPDPSAYLRIRQDQIGGRSVCLVDVRAPVRSSSSGPWFWLRTSKREARFFVRRGAGTRELAGSEVDNFRQAQPLDPRI